MKIDTRGTPAAAAHTDTDSPRSEAEVDNEVALIAKRHRISPAIVREIMRRSGANDRASIEREIAKGKARR